MVKVVNMHVITLYLSYNNIICHDARWKEVPAG